MKKLLITALLAIVVLGCATAQDAVYYESTPTLMWDAVTTDSDGNPFLPGDTVEYEVYLWDMANGDVTTQLVADLTLYETTTLTESVLSFPYRAEWVCAVRVRHTDGGGTVSYSELGYSTVVEDVALSPFSYVPILIFVPMQPSGLRDSGT
jgi:hypothetical protein